MNAHPPAQTLGFFNLELCVQWMERRSVVATALINSNYNLANFESCFRIGTAMTTI